MIILKTSEEISVMAEGGRRLAIVFQGLEKAVGPGVKTVFLEELSRKLIREQNAVPAFLGYRAPGSREAYPYGICVSIDDVVVHGRPSDYLIKDGDLVKLDLGLIYGGFYLDSAVTVPVGDVGGEARKLIAVTKEVLRKGIEQARPGKTVGDIGHAIQKHVEKKGFSIIRSLTGHGIGRNLHEEPQVLNFGESGVGEELRAGMVLAIEPMVAAGGGATRELKDGSFVTADGSLAAHFEHTVAITEHGPKVLTVL